MLGWHIAMPIRHYAPARRGSVAVAPWQRQRLGHADRLRIMEAARRRERATYRRGSGRHGGELRETGLRVLWALLYRGWGRAGACDPALAQIAAEARLARSTVQDALARLRLAGIVWWVPRGLVACGRWVQITSAYLFASPATWSPERPAEPSDTGSRAASVSEDKNHQEEVPWWGDAAPDPARIAAAAARWGLVEAAG
ncbi:MAG: hypothetical protein ACLGJD_28735 [Gammaproteobacteria bacterium]